MRHWIHAQRSRLLESEIEAAAACNRDFPRIPAEITALRSQFVDFYESVMNQAGKFPAKSEFAAVRRLRRMIMRVVSDRYCRALLPSTTELINPRCGRVSRLLSNLPAGATDGTWFSSGARGREYEKGPTRVIHGVLKMLLLNGVNRMFDEFPADRAILLKAYTELTRSQRELAAKASEELFGHQIDASLLEDPYGAWVARARPEVDPREQEYAFIAGSMATDLRDLLEQNNVPSQAEFLAVGISDLEQAYDIACVPRGQRYATSLRHIALLGSVATLTSDKARRLIFDSAIHRNLWRVDKHSGSGVWTIRAAGPPLSSRPLEHEHRCPGPDALRASSADHIERAILFAEQLQQISGDPSPIDPAHISAASVAAAVAVSAWYHLQSSSGPPNFQITNSA